MKKQVNYKNPAQAYLQGKRDGNSEGVINGFVTSSTVIICSMYNANIENEFMDDGTFGKFLVATEKEHNRIFTEELHQSPETVPDEIIAYTNKIRKQYGLDKL